MAENDAEQIVFGQDDEPVKAEDTSASVADAAKADAESAKGAKTSANAKAKNTKESGEDVAEDSKASEADATTDEANEATDAVAKELEETKTRYMYLYAEYDNYRKRTQKEKDNLYSDAVAKVAGEFLGVIDNIDRALASAKSTDGDSSDKVLQGVEMVSKQAVEILGKIGIEEIAVERGTKFDPNFHEAVMHIEDADLGEQEVAQVFQKGYQYKDRVIRHAVVQVAN